MAPNLATAGPVPDESVAELVRRTQDAERRRAAREIHDRLGYWLSLARVELDLFDLHQDRDPDRADANLTVARRAIVEGLMEIRHMVTELRSPRIVQSLEQALRFAAASAAPASSVRVVVDGDEQLLSGHVVDELFLVLREALRNAFEHAGATTVTTLVSITASRVLANVVDDGRGCDPERLAHGSGIASMRERAELLGGSISVTSAPGRGCAVEILIRT